MQARPESDAGCAGAPKPGELSLHGLVPHQRHARVVRGRLEKPHAHPLPQVGPGALAPNRRVDPESELVHEAVPEQVAREVPTTDQDQVCVEFDLQPRDPLGGCTPSGEASWWRLSFEVTAAFDLSLGRFIKSKRSRGDVACRHVCADHNSC
jgi:hypothetical protein